jgi:predicted RNase H-like nuclease (RuvC/YqgF family)
LLTKILAIASLIMSVVYFGVTATLFSYRVNYKTLYENVKKDYQSYKEKAESEIEKAKKDYNELYSLYLHSNAEREAVLEKYKTVKNLLDNAKSELANLSQNYSKLEKNYNELNLKIENLFRKNEELEKEKSALLAEREKFEQLYTQELQKNLALSERQGQIEEENAELSKMLVEKTKELEEAKEKLQRVKELEIPIPEISVKKKLIEGYITAVSKKVNLVLCSVGEEHGVEVGDQFTVYRKDKYIGKIVIDRVWKDGSAGHSILDLEKEKIQVGDKITTRIF